MQCVEWIVPGLPRCRQPRAPPGEGPEKMSLLAGGADPRPSTRQKMRLPIGRAAAIDKTSRRHIFPPRFRWRGAACRPLPERERERGGEDWRRRTKNPGSIQNAFKLSSFSRWSGRGGSSQLGTLHDTTTSHQLQPHHATPAITARKNNCKNIFDQKCFIFKT